MLFECMVFQKNTLTQVGLNSSDPANIGRIFILVYMKITSSGAISFILIFEKFKGPRGKRYVEIRLICFFLFW